jgi:hypothetical protein
MGNRRRNIKLVAVLITILSWATLTFAFSAGPPPANTGAPGEGTCNDCHSSFSINSQGGSVKLAGLPQNYTPGMQYNLTVTVAQTNMMRWGFEITALTDDGSAAGTFVITDTDKTQLITDNSTGKVRNYVEHTLDGSQRGVKDSANFNFAWMAPASNIGNITFYLAGNAANGDGTMFGDAIYTTNIKISAVALPTLASIDPNNGPANGGTTVTLTGSNFNSGATVAFDGISASATFINNKSITAVTPPHAAGAVDVVVKNPDGTAAKLKSAFTYDASQLPMPTLTAIMPMQGPASGGTMVTIEGNNFVSGLNVKIGARDAIMVSATSAEITALTPPGDAGAVDVVVTNPDGQSAILPGAFTYKGDQALSVKLLSPVGGEVLSAGGFPFTIAWMPMSSMSATQKLELSTDSGATFDTVIVDNLTADKTSFAYAAPAGLTSDKARVRISINDNGMTVSDVSGQDFRILPAPTISNITAKVAATIKLTIAGTMFQPGAIVQVNGNNANTKVKSATAIMVKKLNKSLAGTQIHVTVHNPDGTISAEKIIMP